MTSTSNPASGSHVEGRIHATAPHASASPAQAEEKSHPRTLLVSQKLTNPKPCKAIEMNTSCLGVLLSTLSTPSPVTEPYVGCYCVSFKPEL